MQLGDYMQLGSPPPFKGGCLLKVLASRFPFYYLKLFDALIFYTLHLLILDRGVKISVMYIYFFEVRIK